MKKLVALTLVLMLALSVFSVSSLAEFRSTATSAGCPS